MQDSLNINFQSLTFKPHAADLAQVNRMMNAGNFRGGVTHDRLDLSFADGTLLQFAGRFNVLANSFQCAPWMLARDNHTRQFCIINANR